MAGWGNFVLDKGFDVSGALTIYRCVKLTAAETVGPCTAITDFPIGVAQYGVTALEMPKGKQASVRVIGVSEVETSGAVGIGQRVQLETNGTVTAEVGASGKRLVGICVGDPSTSTGQRTTVLFLAGLGLA